MAKRFIILALVLLFSLKSKTETLPNSINIATGIPLTITTDFLKSQDIVLEKNSGGWGDVMSNVKMALDLKRRFPQITVRLIVTKNDQETRSNSAIGNVGNFISDVLRNKNGNVYLDHNSRERQIYRKIEIYFLDLTADLMTDFSMATPEERSEIIKETRHIPTAELGINFSGAHDVPITKNVLKSKFEIYLTEYNYQNEKDPLDKAFKFNFLLPEKDVFWANSGISGLGYYGLNSQDDSRGSLTNKNEIDAFFAKLRLLYPDLANELVFTKDSKIAFAYAGGGTGDSSIVEDYIEAASEILKKSKHSIIVFNGLGAPVVKQANGKTQIFIPLGPHSLELAHAFIAESSLSPLVTGDGTLSSALATTSVSKTALYEMNPWKKGAFLEILAKAANGNSALLERLKLLAIPTTQELTKLGLSRQERVDQIRMALAAADVHLKIHEFLSSKKRHLDIGENIIKFYKNRLLISKIKTLKKQRVQIPNNYINWLGLLTKQYQFGEHQDLVLLKALSETKLERKETSQRAEAWYAAFTLMAKGFQIPEHLMQRLFHQPQESTVHMTRKLIKVEATNDEIVKSFLMMIKLEGQSNQMLSFLKRNPMYQTAVDFLKPEIAKLLRTLSNSCESIHIR